MSDKHLPVNIDNAKLNAVARSMLHDVADPNKTKLSKTFQVMDKSGQAHTFSFEELSYLMAILDRKQPIEGSNDVLNALVTIYALNDLIECIKAGYGVTQYTVKINNKNKSVDLVGKLEKLSTNKNHPTYDPTDKSKALVFEYLLEDFDFVQQITLSRLIASLNTSLEEVAFTFDVDYVFEWVRGSVRVYSV